MTHLFFETALLPEGWIENVCVEVDDTGWISAVKSGSDGAGVDFRGAIGLPGMPNCHSHSFQGAMAGLTESPGSGRDGFLNWRQAMYGLTERLTPDDLTAIAAQFYVEMLEAGFTAVAEFHYLHHAADGLPYDDPGTMSSAIVEAAVETGIGLTLLPVFYSCGGFGGASIEESQRRFYTTPESYLRLLQRVRQIVENIPDYSVGMAPHSLRAVTPDHLTEILAVAGTDRVHIHVAEQIKEVDECLIWCGARPVEWLLDNISVDGRWCLIHATHMTPAENRRLAASGAVVGLCPITEANLGDGIFGAIDFVGNGGRIAIGTDSNVRVDVAEELRLLEYSQRLRDRTRNCLAGTVGSTGRALFEQALDGGAIASGRRIGRLAPGYRADIVSLDSNHSGLYARSDDAWLDSWIFGADSRAVSDVWVGGQNVVAGGRHSTKETIARRYREVLSRLMAS